MKNPTIKDYPINVYWDEQSRYYVAEVSEIPTCSADGPTAATAISNLEETFAVMKESYHEENLTLPLPRPSGGLTIEMLKRMAPLVKIAALAKEAGMPPNRLATKLRRSQPLQLAEGRALSRALRNLGVILPEPTQRSG